MIFLRVLQNEGRNDLPKVRASSRIYGKFCQFGTNLAKLAELKPRINEHIELIEKESLERVFSNLEEKKYLF